MNALEKLQRWYLSNCDGEWEHAWGVEIGTIDNPGWRIKINLQGTKLEKVPFEERKFQYDDGRDWYLCWRSELAWEAAGGPLKLDEMLEIFLKWAESQKAV